MLPAAIVQHIRPQVISYLDLVFNFRRHAEDDSLRRCRTVCRSAPLLLASRRRAHDIRAAARYSGH